MYKRQEEILVIHTLVISPAWSGRGKGREFVAFAEKTAARLGCKAIRLDTYEGNPVSYTHLDVYKRQTGSWEMRRSRR